MKKRVVWFGLGAVLLCTVDRLTKIWAEVSLKNAPIDIGVLFRLTYTENTGVAFGMLNGQRVLTTAVVLIILAAVIGYLIFSKKRLPLMSEIGLWMIVSGGLGNLYDRLFKPAGVIDFIEPLFVNFAVFNFADICVTCGAVIAMIGYLTVKGKTDNDGKV